MGASSLDEFMKDNHDAILVAVAARMRGDDQMLARRRQAAAERERSVRPGARLLAAGHPERSDPGVHSRDGAEHEVAGGLSGGSRAPVRRHGGAQCFAEISAEIDSRLDSEELRGEYAAYRAKVDELVAGAFPH